MTQLNIGNKGCKNLEGKQESLPVISFWLFLSLSLSLCYNNLIFLAAVSLETAVRVFLDRLRGYVHDALAMDFSLSSDYRRSKDQTDASEE